MTLHQDEALFEELIITTSASLGIPEVFIEKDYWVCAVLKGISKLDSDEKAKVVFKGGTSLSKAHKLIERFSEDIDLAIIVKGMSQHQAKSFLKSVERKIVPLSLKALSEHPQISKGSKFRKTVHEYPKRISGGMGDAKEVLLLELNTYTNPTPNSPQRIGSYIYDFLMSRDEQNLIKEFDLGLFEINVLDIERTLCEKISAIAKASYDSNAELQSKIRHLYDIYLLMQLPQVHEFFNSEDFYKMMEVVKDDDENFSHKETNSQLLEESPIFKHSEETLQEVESYYNSTFASLVYGILPPFEQLVISVKTVADRLEEPNE